MLQLNGEEDIEESTTGSFQSVTALLRRESDKSSVMGRRES